MARDLTILIALTIALHGPFIGQAFHLDDTQYLDVALNVFRNPLFPMDLPSVLVGQHLTLWGHTHPPLNAYLIAALVFLHGGPPSEIFLHTSFLLFPILLSVSFYFLARRFAGNALIASVLLATNPTLMVSAHTLMADVPLMALWVCGTVLFVRGVDERRPLLRYIAVLPITAACFYAYQGLALLPLLAFYALVRKQLGWREVAILATPVFLMAAWQLSGYLHRGVTYASTMFEYIGVRGLWLGATKVRTAIASLTYLGGTILPFPFIFWKMGQKWKGSASLAAIAIALVIAYQRFPEYTWPEKLFFIGCFAGGLVAVAWIAARGFESFVLKGWAADDAFLSLWFVGMLIGCVLAFFSGSARYLLPACPALLLVMIRSVKRATLFFASLIVIQVILGLSLSYSDYEFAGLGRREARDFESRYLSRPQPFLFSAEWGLRFYLSSMGGQIAAEDTTGLPGELFIESRLALGRTLELGRGIKLIERHSYGTRSPLRLLSPDLHAGFWSDGWGVLPFWFSRAPLDEFSVYRVK